MMTGEREITGARGNCPNLRRRRSNLWRTLAQLTCAMLATGAIDSVASAQPTQTNLVPSRRTTDARGVDLTNGDMRTNVPLVSFGSGGTGLAASFDLSPLEGGLAGPDFLNTAGMMMGLALRPRARALAVHSEGETKDYENVVFPNGAGFVQQSTILWLNPDGSYNIHTNTDGSQYTHSFGPNHFTRFISSPDPSLVGLYNANGDRAVAGQVITDSTLNTTEYEEKVILANGEEWRFYRQYVTVPCHVNIYCSSRSITRLRFVTSSRGYGIQFLYVSDSTPASDEAAGSWYAPRRVTGYNKATVYCNEPALVECAAVSALPSADISYNGGAGTVTITPPGAAGSVELTLTRTGSNWGIPFSIRNTVVSSSTISYLIAVDETDAPYISRVTDSDGQWNYTRTVYVDDSGHVPLMSATSTNPAGGQVQITGYAQFGQLQTYTDELLRPYNFSAGFPYRDWNVSYPESNENYVDRDERNNITALYQAPKAGGSGTITAYTAVYPIDCSNPRTCNHPTSVTDANAHTTDYTYAPEHGGVLTETGPAVPTRQSDGSIGNVRPQKRYEYAQRYAWIGNGSAGYTQTATPIWLMTRERHCLTTAASGSSCVGGAGDEVITDYDYGPNSGPNNLALRGTAVTAYVSGTSTTLRTCYGYDASGNRISETQPNANLGSCP